MLFSFLDECINSFFLLTAKPVRPGHYPACSLTNPFFIRGYSDLPLDFHKAGCHNSKNQKTPESEPRLPEANSNQNSPTKVANSQSNNSHDSVQDDTWVWTQLHVVEFVVWHDGAINWCFQPHLTFSQTYDQLKVLLTSFFQRFRPQCSLPCECHLF